MGGRRCLVTGATDPTSIGYACARALLAAGAAHVVVMGRDQAKVEAAVAGLNGEGALWGVCGLFGGMNVQPPAFKADANRKAHTKPHTYVHTTRARGPGERRGGRPEAPGDDGGGRGARRPRNGWAGHAGGQRGERRLGVPGGWLDSGLSKLLIEM